MSAPKLKKEHAASHTPGPWATYCENRPIRGSCVRAVHTIEGQSKYPVANVYGAGPENNANARLIAAAPEMLDILEMLIKHESKEFCANYGITEVFAKATGGA